MRIRLVSFAALAALAATPAFTVPASAHVTLDQPQATAGTTAKLVFRVPHGCQGSAMTTFKVQIPEGVTNVKPQPKAGWQLATVKAKLDKPIVGEHGATITEVVREVVWSGGRLPDDFYDEFALRGQMPDKAGTLYFPVVQECEKGVERWIEIPADGKKSGDYKMPAPGLRLAPRP
ncbi:MAG TPA: YcnI family protein [Alphaproteobacteria bacterium]